MTIASEITKLQTNLTNSYSACENKEATMPANENFDNLPDCINSIKRGFYCAIYVYAPNGTVVTMDGKTKTVSGNYTTFNIYEVGTYTVTGIYQGHTQSTTVSVTGAGSKSASLVFYTTITVNTQPNIVLTCGQETVTATGSTVQFTVWETGTYTITGTLDGHSNTSTVNVSSLNTTYSTSLYLYSNLIVTSDAGVVVTVDGVSKTITDTSVSFVMWQAGSVTITANKNGTIKTKTTSITIGTDSYVSISFAAPTEVSYIQGNGGYINTEFCPQQGDVFTFEVARITYVSSNAQVPVWGSNFTYMNNLDEVNHGVGFGPTHNDRQVCIRQGIARYWNSNGNSGNWAQAGFKTFVLTTGATADIAPTITENGTNIVLTQEGSQAYYDIDNTVPIGIFCSIYNGSAVCITNGVYRLKYFKVTRNGVDVADFRAAITGDGEVGLYDRISTNFVAGVGNIGYQE